MFFTYCPSRWATPWHGWVAYGQQSARKEHESKLRYFCLQPLLGDCHRGSLSREPRGAACFAWVTWYVGLKPATIRLVRFQTRYLGTPAFGIGRAKERNHPLVFSAWQVDIHATHIFYFISYPSHSISAGHRAAGPVPFTSDPWSHRRVLPLVNGQQKIEGADRSIEKDDDQYWKRRCGIVRVFRRQYSHLQTATMGSSWRFATSPPPLLAPFEIGTVEQTGTRAPCDR